MLGASAPGKPPQSRSRKYPSPRAASNATFVTASVSAYAALGRDGTSTRAARAGEARSANDMNAAMSLMQHILPYFIGARRYGISTDTLKKRWREFVGYSMVSFKDRNDAFILHRVQVRFRRVIAKKSPQD